MMPKLDTFVLLTNDGPSMERLYELWCKTQHADDGIRKGVQKVDRNEDLGTMILMSSSAGLEAADEQGRGDGT